MFFSFNYTVLLILCQHFSFLLPLLYIKIIFISLNEILSSCPSLFPSLPFTLPFSSYLAASAAFTVLCKLTISQNMVYIKSPWGGVKNFGRGPLAQIWGTAPHSFFCFRETQTIVRIKKIIYKTCKLYIISNVYFT